MKRAAFVLALVASGCSAPAAPSPSSSTVSDGPVVAAVAAPPQHSSAPEPRSAEAETAAPIGSTGPDARCNDPKGVERIEILQGATTRAPLTGIAITYGGTEHDSYEGGKSDTMLRLTFQGILDDGKLTPSAYSWRPSALAPPSWQYLGGMPLCVRIVSSGPAKVTVELSSQRPR